MAIWPTTPKRMRRMFSSQSCSAPAMPKRRCPDYESAAVALRAKTERLKALRLARDAAAPPQMAAALKRKGTR
jgi:hypothetical protein